MRSRLISALALLVLMALAAACGQPAAPAPATSAVAATAAPLATQAPMATAAVVATTAADAAQGALATAAPLATAVMATAMPAATVANDDGPVGQAAKNLLLEAARAQLAQTAFRAIIQGKDADGKESTVILERVQPDRFRMVADTSQFIIVPEGTFIKEGDAEWQKSPINMSGMMTQILSEQSIEKLIEETAPDELRFVGADLIDAKPMWVYEYTAQEDVGGTMVDTYSKTWIGVLDKLPYRVEATSGTGDAAASSTVTYEYDDSIEIEAPLVSG